ncbi:uncharacterized protein KY384_001471 [Bacidia gigantensis]|uniref:uncharacterized protein n=1 Tax=Bacidia gigantensis TaxID=2732470 RepID=UPI001D04D9B1|nr:uncharacterized protein KY384_001471 [Bacidia gigantensis]KAG8533730.1 hypothetical protein KY384_001471 [Bacidia gigantensis]
MDVQAVISTDSNSAVKTKPDSETAKPGNSNGDGWNEVKSDSDTAKPDNSNGDGGNVTSNTSQEDTAPPDNGGEATTATTDTQQTDGQQPGAEDYVVSLEVLKKTWTAREKSHTLMNVVVVFHDNDEGQVKLGSFKASEGYRVTFNMHFEDRRANALIDVRFPINESKLLHGKPDFHVHETADYKDDASKKQRLQFEFLKEELCKFKGRQYLQEYYSKTRNPLPAKQSFEDAEIAGIILGYAEMREFDLVREVIADLLKEPRDFVFCPADTRLTKNGLPKTYAVYGRLPEGSLMQQFFAPGESGVILVDQGKEAKTATAWPYVARPTLPGHEVYGDLFIFVHRPDEDVREVSSAPKPEQQPEDFQKAKATICPVISDQAHRRLVKAANRLFTKADPKFDDIRTLHMGRDFRPSGDRQLFFNDPKITDKQEKELRARSEILISSQAEAVEHMMSSQHLLSLVQGPPGSGNTFMASIFGAMCKDLDLDEKKARKSDVIRYSNDNDEARNVMALYSSLHGHVDSRQESVNTDKTPDKKLPVATDKAYMKTIQDNLLRTDTMWSGKKHSANVWEGASLHRRLLESLGILVDGKLVKTKPELDVEHPLRVFFDAFWDPDYESKSEQEALEKNLPSSTRTINTGDYLDASFKSAEDESKSGSTTEPSIETPVVREFPSIRSLAIDAFSHILGKASTVHATLSNSDATTLRKAISPEVIVIDEASLAKDLEILMPILNNVDSTTLVVIIGDPRQLAPVVVSKYAQTENETPANPFARQEEYSFYTRLYQNNFPCFMLTEQHRMTEGLSKLCNILSYDGNVVDAIETRLRNRSVSKEIIKFLTETHKIKTDTPHVFLNVEKGVTIVSESKSRYNLENIAVCLNHIKQVLQKTTMTLKDITIIAPYKEQLRKYHVVLHELQRNDAFWRAQDISKLGVKTTDTFQGDENGGVYFDQTTSYYRRCTIGHISNPRRLNVAISRAINFFCVVGDIDTLQRDKELRRFRAAAEDSVEITSDEVQENQKTLSRLHAYYDGMHVRVNVRDPHELPEAKWINFSTSNDEMLEFQKTYACKHCGEFFAHRNLDCPRREESIAEKRAAKNKDMKCYNCQELGHHSSDCDKPKREKQVKTCRNCNKPGHIASQCPDIQCSRCLETGHMVKDYHGKEMRYCQKCGKQGHLSSICHFKNALGKVNIGLKLPGRKQKEVNSEFLPLDELEEENTETGQPEGWLGVAATDSSPPQQPAAWGENDGEAVKKADEDASQAEKEGDENAGQVEHTADENGSSQDPSLWRAEAKPTENVTW